VQIAAAELGLPLDRQLTMTGGLAFFGGPGNNYATHGIAEVVTALREDPDAFGLATALGYYATKHAVGLYSGTPPETPFQAFDVQDQVDALPRRALAENHAGEATVESYTAIFERDGSAGMGVVVGRLGDGRRCAVKSHDPDALAELQASDPLGRTVTVTAPEGFAFT
jgi:acetyl-CoA C-acetyltransferase